MYSSHCLEHMHDPVDALARWWRLVMSSGFLIIVVPDEIKRQRTRFQVQADETGEPTGVVSFRRMSPDTRISMPPSVRVVTIRAADAEPVDDRVAESEEATTENDS